MLAGHYTTALIAKQKAPKGSLIFFLIISQLPDLLWLVLHFLGIEPTEPTNVLDVSLDNLSVEMIYSHDLLPILGWIGLSYALGLLLFKSQKVGVTSALLLALHALVDYLGGYPHNIFGTDTLSVGTGLYYSQPYLAVALELIFSAIVLYLFFKTEKKNNIKRTKRQRNWIIGIFTFNIIFMFSIADLSTRDLLATMNIDFATEFGFQTTIPVLAIMYVMYIYLINKHANLDTK
ncbi:MAG: hypothetical protein ED556_07185 [Winogradskyella sp.]|uniref:hypothetical protein n=1 Tax=Winogradskyella sp. TaxID=1883156 RepID=UPI000F3C3CF0|nr:hypothetical protein [Winogradskyella sp.]RNC87197.1 MAG: hypothetical protein ED556_07185 [Winogradskyella sp.]